MPDTNPEAIQQRRTSWKALVAEVEDLSAPTPAYEFTRRTFTETKNSGIYRTEEDE